MPERDFSANPESAFQIRLALRERQGGIVTPDQLVSMNDRIEQYYRFHLMIGRTPLLRLSGPNSSIIWIKDETANPTESHYDRATLKVLRTLEQEKFIEPGDRILEGTSGSAGRSFAYFCNRLGFGLDIIIPKELPAERTRDMEALGARLIRTEREGGIGEVISHYKRLLVTLKRDGWEQSQLIMEGKPIFVFKKNGQTIVAPNHSEIEITPRAFQDIAQEAIDGLPGGARIDTFVGTLGNGSTVKGISEVLRKHFSDVRVVGTETLRAPTNAIRKLRLQFGKDQLGLEFERRHGFKLPSRSEMSYHDSYGASTSGYEPPFVEVDKIDEIRLVGDEWRELKRDFNESAYESFEDDSTMGNTSAENLFVARQLANEPGGRGRNFLILFYDKADQYPDWPPNIYRPPTRPFELMLDFVRRTSRPEKPVRVA